MILMYICVSDSYVCMRYFFQDFACLEIVLKPNIWVTNSKEKIASNNIIDRLGDGGNCGFCHIITANWNLNILRFPHGTARCVANFCANFFHTDS